MKKKILISSAAILVLGGVSFLFFGSNKSSNSSDLPKVKVVRGMVVDKALAVGTIEPENEISVKSKVS
ncbi:MAG: efflux RND transporter periplasmic adaptor subunit, partial [Ignavibacteriae bacterium]